MTVQTYWLQWHAYECIRQWLFPKRLDSAELSWSCEIQIVQNVSSLSDPANRKVPLSPLYTFFHEQNQPQVMATAKHTSIQYVTTCSARAFYLLYEIMFHSMIECIIAVWFTFHFILIHFVVMQSRCQDIMLTVNDSADHRLDMA